MKNWIFLIIVFVIGFIVHQIYTGFSQDTLPEDPTAYKNLPPIPEKCEEDGDILEDAIYGHEMGKLTAVELDRYTRMFQSCLRNAGYNDSQISRMNDEIKEAALNADSGD